MSRLLKVLFCLTPLATLGQGCATNVDPGEDPYDSDLEPAPEARATLDTLWFRTLPSERPYQAEGVFGGNVRLGGTFRGDSWALAYAPGVVDSTESAQLISSSLTDELSSDTLDLTWSTKDFTVVKDAGADPTTDDVFSVLLTAQSSSSNGESHVSATDAIQLKIDNTPPISKITRICRDEAGTDCFGFTANPADVGATNRPDELMEVSTKQTSRLYVYGLAVDKNFTGYSFRMVGGQATSETFLCLGQVADNASCTGAMVRTGGAFGYGLARDVSYVETLAGSNMIDAYSDDVLLMVWDISYLTPDAYGLHLNVGSLAYEDGNDDPTTNSNWITLVVTS